MAFSERVKTVLGDKSSRNLNEFVMVDSPKGGHPTRLSPNTYIVQESQSIQSVIDSCPSPAVDNLFEVMIPVTRRDESWTDADYVTVITVGHEAKLPEYADANAAIKGGLAGNRFYQASEVVKVVPEKVLIMKDVDADQSINIILSLPAGKSLLIERGDAGADITVNGPQILATTTITYGDTAAYEVLISGDLDSITYFKITGEPISKIYNIHYLTSLTILDLHSNSLTEIGTVTNLTSLTNLSLYANSLTDIGTITNLTDLTALYLNNNSLTDVGSVAGLTSLVTLFLYSNSLSAIGSVTNLTSLASLYLHSNSFSSTELSDHIDQAWDNRVALRALSCAIKIESNDSTPSCDADAVAKIEGTGDYAGDGLKDGAPGCTVTYDA